MGSEQDLTEVLEEAAGLAAELAVEIGEPVSPALTSLRTSSANPVADAPLEDASDLDEQLANLQELVDDAAAGVDTPPETLDEKSEESGEETKQAAATAQVAASESPPEANAQGDESSAAESGGETTGVVGNMPKKPTLQPPPPPTVEEPAAKGAGSDSKAVSAGQSIREKVVAAVLSAGEVIARFLELIDEPFQFIGKRPRVAIGWLALGTVGASLLVAVLSMLL